MFALIVIVLAIMAVAGILFRIADATTTESATITRNPPKGVTASRALRASDTLRPSAHSRAAS